MLSEWVHHMDALEGLRQIPDGSVDAVVTDPPYGINFGSKRTGEICAWDERDAVKRLWADFVPHMHRVMRDNSVALVFSNWSEMWARDVLANYFDVKSCIVWVKNVFGLGQYTRHQHEFIYLCFKGTPDKFPETVPDVWHHDRCPDQTHPTQKPLDIIMRCVRISSKEGELVLDPFMGSGTTAVACKRLGRRFIGFEQDSRWHKLAIDRLRQNPITDIYGSDMLGQ